MSPNRDQAWLWDIQEAAKDILDLCRNISDEQKLLANKTIYWAILYRFEVLGEAVKRLSSETLTAHPEIPWNRFAKFRDVVTHQYDQIKSDVVWEIFQQKVPKLVHQLSTIIGEEP